MFDNFTRMALLNAPAAMVLSTFTTEPLGVEVSPAGAQRQALATGPPLATEAAVRPTVHKRRTRVDLRFGFGI